MGATAGFTEELIEMIYAAMLGETSWQAFLNRLNDISPDAFSSLFFHDMNRQSGEVTLISGGSEAVLSDYANYYSRINPWMQKVAATPLGVGIIGEQIVAREAFNKSEYYNDFINRNGMETGVGVTLFRDEGCYFLLSILTGDKETDRNLERAELLGRLAPHLQRVFRYYRSGPFHQSALSFSQAVGASVDAALIVVDDRLRVRCASASGENCLAQGSMIGLGPLGRVRLTDPNQHAALCQMFERGPDAQRTLVFHAAGHEIQMTRIGLTPNVEFFAGPSVAILITPMARAAQGSVEHIMQASYSLTPAESRVLTGILAGNGLREIAQAHGIGIETVRSQLKKIYHKTGVNSQADIIRLVARLPLRMRN